MAKVLELSRESHGGLVKTQIAGPDPQSVLFIESMEGHENVHF